MTALAAVVLLSLVGVGAGVVYGLTTNDSGEITRLAAAAAAYAPAIWALTGATMVLVGLTPRFTSVAWGVIVANVAIVLLGRLLDLPQALLRLSVFEHLPLLPAETAQIVPSVALTLAGVVGAGTGVLSLRARDIG